jgi:hypothetical protein
MAVSSRAKKPEPGTSIVQVMSIIVLVVAAAALAMFLYRISFSGENLGEMISGIIPSHHYPLISAFFWLMELSLYAGLAWWKSGGQPIWTISGVVWGIVMRLVINLLVAVVISAPAGLSTFRTLGRMDGELWVYRLIGIAVSAGILFIVYRQWIAPDDTPTAARGKSAGAGSKSSFAFSQKKTTPAPAAPPRRPIMPPIVPQAGQTPPEGFVMPPPQPEVFGVATVPGKVILDAVPEAQAFLAPDTKVPIPLSLIIPQMKRCTVWLTWQQVFANSQPGPMSADEQRMQLSLRDRWVRIDPKHYALQVPREYYRRPVSKPAWLSTPAVPQEEHFHLHEQDAE